MKKGLSDTVVNKMQAEYHLKSTAFHQTNRIIKFPEEKKRKRVDTVKAANKRKSNVPEQKVTIIVPVTEASALYASQKEIEGILSLKIIKSEAFLQLVSLNVHLIKILLSSKDIQNN